MVSETNSQPVPGDPCGYVSNTVVLWTEQDFQTYVSNYRKKFYGKWETHTRAMYLNTGSFLFLNAFFKAYPDYKGVNIHFSIYGKPVVDGQYDKDQFILYFTPTKCLMTSPSDYDILAKFQKDNELSFPLDKINTSTICPGLCDETTKNFGTPIPVYGRLENVGAGSEGIFVFDKSLLKAYKERYKKKTSFLGIRNRKHTRSVYVSKEKIGRIACFIEGNDQKLFPAIGIYLASYNEMISETDQAHKKQITVGFVPMKRVEGKYLEPDPKSYNDYVLQHCLQTQQLKFSERKGISEKKGKEEAKSENHGELCPKICPPDGE